MSWVLPGVELVRTRFLRFTSTLMREDFPTLERPAKAISGRSPSGYWLGFVALFMNSVLLMIKGGLPFWVGLRQRLYPAAAVVAMQFRPALPPGSGRFQPSIPRTPI